ncbi:GNAT family N-acetyltransferase [Streptomyces sp. NPDC088725]|uniref:GNAT family N-acetyltransferase n=1 Tax=Streptomyces sp. NPDC088725 TaxID=3365873 RepID=UPI00380643A7
MSDARPATSEDAVELVRLRKVMFDSMDGATAAADWQPAVVATPRERLADPEGDLAAFVVERPGGTGSLAACAVGAVEHRLGGPRDPSGVCGHVFSVATDPDMRRLGHSRACVEALLGWFRARGVRRIDLNASDEGAPLYASLGFVRTPSPAMRLTL